MMKKWSTFRFPYIRKEVTSYKIHILSTMHDLALADLLLPDNFFLIIKGCATTSTSHRLLQL